MNVRQVIDKFPEELAILPKKGKRTYHMPLTYSKGVGQNLSYNDKQRYFNDLAPTQAHTPSVPLI